MRPEKAAIVEEVRGRLEEGGFALLADYRGLTVEQLQTLRQTLRSDGLRIQVVKNAFLRLAAEHVRWDPAPAGDGTPTAVITGAGEATRAARILMDYAAEVGLAMAKGGWLDSRVLSRDDVEQMAMLPSREVMLGRLVGTLAAPMSRLASVMTQKLASVVYVLRAFEDKRHAAH